MGTANTQLLGLGTKLLESQAIQAIVLLSLEPSCLEKAGDRDPLAAIEVGVLHPMQDQLSFAVGFPDLEDWLAFPHRGLGKEGLTIDSTSCLEVSVFKRDKGEKFELLSHCGLLCLPIHYTRLICILHVIGCDGSR